MPRGIPKSGKRARPSNPGGMKPGTTGADIRGIQVKYSDQVQEVDGHGYGRKTGRYAPAGWFLWVQMKRAEGLKWEAVVPLRFNRMIDASRARDSLMSAELDSAKRMKAAGAETVIRTAYEALQW